MIHYFNALPKDGELDFETNRRISAAIQGTTKRSLTPFYQYLETSISSMRKKEEVKATWKKVSAELYVELKLQGYLYRIDKESRVKVKVEKGLYEIVNQLDISDLDEVIKYRAGEDKGEFELSPEDIIDGKYIKLPLEYEHFDRVVWGLERPELKPAWVLPQVGMIIRQESCSYEIKRVDGDTIAIAGILKEDSPLFMDDRELDCELVTSSVPSVGRVVKDGDDHSIVYHSRRLEGYRELKKIAPYIDIDNLTLEDGSEFAAEHEERLVFEIRERSLIGQKVVDSKGLEFTIEEPRQGAKDRWWIQLEELDDGGEDLPGFSPLKYFFDDDIKVKDSEGNSYQVAHGNDSENRIVLKRDEFRGEYCFPPESAQFLMVKVNTYQLERQQEAVTTVQGMPVGEHARLIKLFEARGKVHWPRFSPEIVTNWAVLKDSERSGAQEQRHFVNIALATPDFAILEGPPGSGKTTVILELICKLAERGQRVLLCGSTHVAIDNVLERLKERRDGITLLERFKILPVRIGDEKRISADIKEFQINNLIEEGKIEERLLLEAANLVCGTTIGILQHPTFKARARGRGRSSEPIVPIVPDFDYLIIDESSKTTFQEFLVPALYAKRWILAGDVMQLSPFTDREQVVSNLANLPLKEGKSIAPELQRACFILQKIKMLFDEKRGNNKNRFIYPLSESEMRPFHNELCARVDKGLFIDRIFTFITDRGGIENYKGQVMAVQANSIDSLKLVASDLIFVKDSLLEQLEELLPDTFVTLNYENWPKSEHGFRHNYRFKKGHNLIYRDGRRECRDSFEITESLNSYFREKSWADEIAWRIDREHQLRLSSGAERKMENYRAVVADLLPFSSERGDIENRVNTLASVAFPSILESLVKGIKGRKGQQESTISEGFRADELSRRRVVLKYQHRMHPHISYFPRKQFYTGEKEEGDALLDLERPQHIRELREWGYTRYSYRRIWLDVKGETRRNYNDREAERMLQELAAFVKYAEKNPHPEDKEWSVACLTFYRGQEKRSRERLQKVYEPKTGISNFHKKLGGGGRINIKLHTVDKFQGQEADIVFLSMVQTSRDGFLDSPNRLNVAITRARYQLVIIGSHEYFAKKSRAEALKELARQTEKED